MKNVHTLCGAAAAVLGAAMLALGYRMFLPKFMIAAGLAWIVYGVLCEFKVRGSAWARHMVRLCNIGLVLALVSFIAVQCVIFSDYTTDARYDEEYVIALGAGLHGERPSLAMQSRIDALVDYMNKNPDATAILCGGMGSGETITEAEAFRRALIDAGIPRARMIKEDTSENTAENLENAAAIIRRDGTAVAVVTNDFHLWRGKLLARRAGLDPTGVCAPTPRIDLTIQYHLREYFSIIKALILH